MAYSIKVKTEGMQRVIVETGKYFDRARNFTAPLKKGVLVMLRSVNQNFQESGRPTAWPPLAFSTIRQKLRRGYSLKPLIRTGQLKRSITGYANQNRMAIGTSVSYAVYHHFGTRHMPKRRFLLFQDKDIERIQSLVADYIVKGDR